MRTLPNSSVALFEADGTATRTMRATLDGLPRAPLVDKQGRATVPFRRYLQPLLSSLPRDSEVLASDGKPTRFLMRLMGQL